MAAKKQTLQVEGRSVTVSNLDKPMYPQAGFTKADVIDYYIRVSPYLLPHFKDRPVTLKRYPEGITGEHFYEKDAPSFTPDWVQTTPVPRKSDGGTIDYVLINDVATLVWCANLASLELHPFLHRVGHLDRPDYIVFDLDPGEGADLQACIDVAFLLRNRLDGLKLRAFPKVSGSKGMQIYVPLNTDVTYDLTRPFAKTLAELLAQEHPDLIVAEMSKHLRGGKVFIDWSQNSDFKTTVGVYSLRAKRHTPFVSMPVTWEELETARKAGENSTLYFQPAAALERLKDVGDLFAPVLTLKQKLPKAFDAKVAKSAPTPKPLVEYKRKRNFSVTPEPGPTIPTRSRQGSRRRFVVQKHQASHLHYDFRLEMHGTLKSWAVPKGVPYKKEERRLAMETEDHPLEYLQFEGVIPHGQYGGGTVMVWDIGTYDVIEGNVYKGFLHFSLAGKKLKGEWNLRRTPEKGERNWVLERVGSAMKPPADEDRSALSGRTLEEIAKARSATWHSREAQPDLDKLPAAKLEFVPPMRALLVGDLPSGADWLYEIKLDGYRAEAVRTASALTLYSRNGNQLNDRFKAIARELENLEPGTIVDGEVVALDDRGRPAFQELQNWQTTKQPIFYYVFDVLAYRGKSLMGAPLSQRRAVLETHVLAGLKDPVRLSRTLDASATDLIAAAREQGLEGLVTKRADSRYEPGNRSGAWVKYKVNQSQELVIGGYMPGAGGFTSLLVGYYEGRKLMFVAKVKNGFTPATKKEVLARMKPLQTDVCPFANLPEPKGARRGEALTAEVMKKCVWVKPKLVAHVQFTEWTPANHLRHSSFGGLRDDVDPRKVRHETPAA